MRARCVGIWLPLVLVASVARANGQTPTVKASPLARVRAELTHYDLAPQGTVALLPQLGELARTLSGPEAAEAAFLRAAAASDLFFLAGFLGNQPLRVALAAAVGVTSDAALAPAIASELTACAHGLYREPALLAVAALQGSEAPEAVPTGPVDLRRDARFLHAAVELMRDPAAGARFAALTLDPCTRESCPAAYADFDAEGRRAFVYLEQLSAAALRFERGRGEGDPLIEALAPVVARDIATVRAFTLRLPPRIPGDPLQSNAADWPAPDVVVFARAADVAYARSPRVQFGATGAIERIADLAPVYPALTSIRYSASDSALPTKAIDDLVTGLRALRGEAPEFRASLIVEPEMTSLLPSRTLASLRRAGVTQLRFAAVSKTGELLSTEVRVVIVNLDPAGDPELKLRVRVGGYSLDVGRGVTDIPRIRDQEGLHFDVATLSERAKSRAAKSAAVSFMPDVATEQVLVALLQIAPAHAPIDLWIQ